MTKRERFYFGWKKYLKEQEREEPGFNGLIYEIRKKGTPVPYGPMDMNHVREVYAKIMSVPAPEGYY